MYCFYYVNLRPIVFRHMRFEVTGGRKKNLPQITVVVVIFVREQNVLFSLV